MCCCSILSLGLIYKTVNYPCIMLKTTSWYLRIQNRSANLALWALCAVSRSGSLGTVSLSFAWAEILSTLPSCKTMSKHYNHVTQSSLQFQEGGLHLFFTPIVLMIIGFSFMYISEHIEKITTKNKKEILALMLDSSRLLVKSQSCPIHPQYVNTS